MTIFLVWSLLVLLLALSYPLWRRRRSGHGAQFHQRLTWLFLAFGLVPSILITFLFTRAMDQVIASFTLPGVEATLRGAIEALQRADRPTEEQLAEVLRREGPWPCLKDSTVLWIAELSDSLSARPLRSWGDTALATRYFAEGGRLKASGQPDGMVHYLRVRSRDGRSWLLARRYPPEIGHALLELGRSLRTYGLLALLREGILREQVVWASGASLIVLLALLAVVVARGTARRVAEPIARLRIAMEQITQGRLDVSVPESGAEEIATLARTFNRMVRELREGKQRLARSERLGAWRDVAWQMVRALGEAVTPAQRALRHLPRDRGAEAEEALLCLERVLAEMSELTAAFSPLADRLEAQPEELDLNPMLREVVSLLEAEVHGVRFRFEADELLGPARLDPTRVRWVLENLLRRLASAALPHSTLWVKSSRPARSEFAAEVEIRAEAVGEDWEGIAVALGARPLSQLKADALSLLVARLIVEEEGGEITLAETPDGGVVIALRLAEPEVADGSERQEDSG
jgi:nitrogen fixation/metabolism regulation signal transduction histidine kinase